ncbi:winged helix-turn-helix transcriptional regulator [Nocardia wallacei]|uniref:winged helix-turn-helix transcriptional regulator n=1 Tax=Nocardia wallacei TaxID=480035 RepID=UPI002457D998|nr:winged helix-turn-helix transcriptional regulator [Nocardia wallacei]
MAKRSYNQYCGLSRSLDLVGERWTLLIVRELMSGPKRYSDLATALAGIGTNLLAARVQQLEREGLIVREQLPPPAASQVYELSAAGRELAQALVPLAMWGLRHRFDEPRQATEHYRAEWTLVFVAALIDPAAVAGVRSVVQFRLEDSAAALIIDNGRVRVAAGEMDSPDLLVITDLPTLAEFAWRTPRPDQLATRLRIEGDTATAQLLIELLCDRAQPPASAGEFR